MELQGRNGKRYRLLPHETRGVRTGRGFAWRRAATASPRPAAVDLKLAALADLRMFVAVDLVIFAVAVVMSALTTANGGPLAKSGAPVTLGQIVFIIGFWGAVIVGVSLLGLCSFRFLQSSREARATAPT
jgi:hypothetical protein